jgi:hypothetical protein
MLHNAKAIQLCYAILVQFFKHFLASTISCQKYIKLAKIVVVQVLGLVEDECRFSTMNRL